MKSNEIEMKHDLVCKLNDYCLWPYGELMKLKISRLILMYKQCVEGLYD